MPSGGHNRHKHKELKNNPLPKRTFYSITSAANSVGLSRRHFYRICQDEQIPVMDIMGSYFIKHSDLQEWISRRSMRRPIIGRKKGSASVYSDGYRKRKKSAA